MKLSADQALSRAESLARAGQPEQAEAIYRAVLRKMPNHKAARAGLARLAAGASADPGRKDSDRLVALYKQGKFAAAAKEGRRLVARRADEPRLHSILGAAQLALGKVADAAESFRAALALDPDYAPAHNNLGLALRAAGRPDEAVASYEAALALNPDYAEAMNNLGVVLQESGRDAEARGRFRAAIAARPGYAQAYANLAVALQKAGETDEAIAHFQAALQHEPDSAEIRTNLGIALKEAGRLAEAVEVLRSAIARRPDALEAHVNLGQALRLAGRRPDAIRHYRDALEHLPDSADLHYNLGIALQDEGELPEADACFGRALAIDPDHAHAASHAMYLKAHLCDWEGLARLAPRLETLGIEGGAVVPFTLLSLEDAPARHRARAERFAETTYGRIAPAPIPRPPGRPEKLRIGYFSADFHHHAVMHLIARLFELHDRDRFEVSAYSLGPDRKDEMRARLVAAFDRFRDIRLTGDREAAALARADGLDIAVDLNGYTQNSRLGLFAHRAAPLQVNYLGYPGTSGAPFIDYILADATVAPEAADADFTEAVIRLPGSYQINDETRRIAPGPLDRAEHGLPEEAVVFCCFNSLYKVMPAEFAIWMRLLGKVEGSVLWLLRSNPWAEKRLRARAAEAGIEPARLVFADRRPADVHLARHRLADLFLDTFNYNAHTTASDALWAGLPLVTFAGRGFPARVAASLLTTLGLPELIATTSEDYEALALRLARAPDDRAALRQKLAAARDRSRLFDPERATRAIEDAYERIHARQLRGEPPAALTL